MMNVFSIFMRTRPDIIAAGQYVVNPNKHFSKTRFLELSKLVSRLNNE